MCKSEYAKQRRATADQELSSAGNGSGGSNRASTSTVDPPPPARRSRQRDIRDMTDTNAQNRLDYLWAAAVAENDLAFNVSKSKSIQAFVDAAVVYGKAYTLPTPYKVSGPLLDKLKADTEDLVRPMKESWKTSGCMLSVDGWTCIKSRGMVKLSLVRPGATRFGTQVIMLGRFLEVKRALRAMVISEEWEEVTVARTEEGMEVRKLLLDDVFWDCGTAVLRLMTPIYEVLRAVDTRAQVMGQIYGLMLEATVKTTEAAEVAGKWLHNCLHAMGWLLNPRNQYMEEVKHDPEIRKGADEVIQSRGGDFSQRITLAAQLAQYHRGEGRLGSDDARWAARTLVEGGRMTDAEWWCLFGGEVQALQEQAVMVLSQPVISSEVERRARDAFDQKAAVRARLYADLGNSTLKEGCAIIPAESEDEEGEAEEEEEPVEEECTIDWSEFGNIGRKRKGKAGESSKGKKGKGIGSCKGKGKGRARDEEAEKEAADSSGEEEEPVRKNPKGRDAWDCSDGSSGEEEEDEEEEDEEEEDE
ncbi:unnamed protein product [Closterium sp. Naga37s-1]|nr:unnamed protein product [Closterium sp. Naga37s-1]